MAKLDAFLAEWWAESGACTWRPDYGRAVVLPVNGDAELAVQPA